MKLVSDCISSLQGLTAVCRVLQPRFRCCCLCGQLSRATWHACCFVSAFHCCQLFVVAVGCLCLSDAASLPGPIPYAILVLLVGKKSKRRRGSSLRVDVDVDMGEDSMGGTPTPMGAPGRRRDEYGRDKRKRKVWPAGVLVLCSNAEVKLVHHLTC